MTTGYIDISQAQSPAEMVFLLSNDLETGNYNSKRIILNMGKLEANQSQILSLKSLINSVESEIDFVYAESQATKLAALNVGIPVANGVYRETPPETEIIEEEQAVVHPHLTEEEAVDILFSSQPAPATNIQETVLSEETKNVYVPLEYPEADTSDDENEESENTESSQENDSEEKDVSSESEESQTDEEAEKEYILSEDIKNFETVYVKQTVRSGQVVSHDGNVVIIGDCNPGSEIIASGDITVWGELKGIAHAGAQGNEKAVIRALKLDAIQLRISGCYARRPDRANVEFSTAQSDTFTPEEARIQDGEIIVFTMNSDKIK